MKVPRRVKWKASSRSMVPTVTPRERCERYFTQSKNSVGPVSASREGAKSLTLSQVALTASHSSEVSVPRTVWAFSRAARRQETMLDGLSRSNIRKCITVSVSITSCCAR